jgi:hypothetical protein
MYQFERVVLRVGKRGWSVEGRAGSGGLVPKVVRLAIFVLRRIICADAESSLVFCRL